MGIFNQIESPVLSVCCTPKVSTEVQDPPEPPDYITKYRYRNLRCGMVNTFVQIDVHFHFAFTPGDPSSCVGTRSWSYAGASVTKPAAAKEFVQFPALVGSYFYTDDAGYYPILLFPLDPGCAGDHDNDLDFTFFFNACTVRSIRNANGWTFEQVMDYLVDAIVLRHTA
jgi:hypothetical protein